MTVDFLTVMSQGCKVQVLMSSGKKKTKTEVPDKLATPIIYFTETKTNVIFFFFSKLFILFIYFVFGHTACGSLGF